MLDPMKYCEEKSRFASMKQGERESLSKFKMRYDHQVQANRSAGVDDSSDELQAIDFIMKLDQKRHRQMNTHMYHNALMNNAAGSYPKNLSEAYRIASLWRNV